MKKKKSKKIKPKICYLDWCDNPVNKNNEKNEKLNRLEKVICDFHLKLRMTDKQLKNFKPHLGPED